MMIDGGDGELVSRNGRQSKLVSVIIQFFMCCSCFCYLGSRGCNFYIVVQILYFRSMIYVNELVTHACC